MTGLRFRERLQGIERPDSEVIERIFGKPDKRELDKAVKNPKAARSKGAC